MVTLEFSRSTSGTEVLKLGLNSVHRHELMDFVFQSFTSLGASFSWVVCRIPRTESEWNLVQELKQGKRTSSNIS